MQNAAFKTALIRVWPYFEAFQEAPLSDMHTISFVPLRTSNSLLEIRAVNQESVGAEGENYMWSEYAVRPGSPYKTFPLLAFPLAQFTPFISTKLLLHVFVHLLCHVVTRIIVI